MNEASASIGTATGEARTWAMLCHLSALVGLLGNGIGFVLGPLFVWLLKRKEHPFVDEQGKESINFQITMFIAFIIAALLMFVFIGFLILPALIIVNIVLPIIGAIKANNGEHYRYPFSIRFLA